MEKISLNNFLRNGTHAGGILKMKGVLDNKKQETVPEKNSTKVLVELNKLGKLSYSDESMTFDQLEVDTEVLKLIREKTNHQQREIAGVFGIPLHKFGIET